MKEIAIKWRGRVPPKFCEVIDARTGNPMGNLDSWRSFNKRRKRELLDEDAITNWLNSTCSLSLSISFRESTTETATESIPPMPSRPPPRWDSPSPRQETVDAAVAVAPSGLVISQELSGDLVSTQEL